MSTEVCRSPFVVTWSVSPDNPRLVRWKRNAQGARWQPWREFATPEDATAAMYANGISQYEPQVDEVTP